MIKRRNNLIVFIAIMLLIPCLTAQNTGYMGKRVIANMGAEFSPAWFRPVCNINFDKEKYNYLAFNCILSPSIEVIAHKTGTAGLVYHYLKTKYNVPYTKDDYDTIYSGDIYILTDAGEAVVDLTAHGFGLFYKQYINGRAPMGPYFRFQFDGFFYKYPSSLENGYVEMKDQLFAMKLEFGNDFLLFNRLRLSTGLSFGLPFGGFKGLGYDTEFLVMTISEQPINEHARSRIFGAYWLGFTVNIGFLAF